jgi:hypothetical protein
MEMDERQALNDLKVIRQVMDRTRKAASGEGGWFMVVGGLMWLLGFLGHQFLPEHLVGWAWAGVNTIGMLTIVWLWMRMERQSSVSSPVLRPIMLSWLALGVFDVLLIWLFEMETIYHVATLFLITIALGCVQMGLLFSHWPLCAVGAAIVVLVVGAFLLAQAYFFLIVALFGGGLMIGSGLWMVRSGG